MLPMSAAAALRRVSEQEFPGTLPLEAQLRFLLRYAVLAPSARNSQPWRFSVEADTVSLRTDLSRWQPVGDPDRRELYQSLGCALENLLVAGEHFGLGWAVTYFPATDPLMAARVRFGPGGPQAAGREPLPLETVLRRRTAHGRFIERPLGAGELRALEAAVCHDPDIVVSLTDAPGLRRAIERLHARAAAVQLGREDYRRELAEAIGRGDLGVPRALGRVAKVAMMHPAVARGLERVERAAFRRASLLAVVSAPADDHRMHVRSGQVLERLWLAATRLGLGLQPASAIIEVADTRAELARLLDLRAGLVPQEVVRIGEPRRGLGRATPRRTAEEVVRG